MSCLLNLTRTWLSVGYDCLQQKAPKSHTVSPQTLLQCAMTVEFTKNTKFLDDSCCIFSLNLSYSLQSLPNWITLLLTMHGNLGSSGIQGYCTRERCAVQQSPGQVIHLCTEALNILWPEAWLLNLYHSGLGCTPACLWSMGILSLLSSQLEFAFRSWQRLKVCRWEGSTQVHNGWRPCFAWRDHSWRTPRGSLTPLYGHWLQMGEWESSTRMESCDGHFMSAPAQPTADSCLLVSKYFYIFSKIITLFALSPSHHIM